MTNTKSLIKQMFKTISIVSIILFMGLWISSKFIDLGAFNEQDTLNCFVVFYLISSLKYYQMELNDKKIIIEKLKNEVRE